MWLFTTQGFYSVVEYHGDPEKLLVRGRAQEDIEALRAQIPSIEPIEKPDADYRWHAIVSRADWEAAVTELAAGIDYRNFKNAVADQQSHERAALYGEVWWEMRPLQDEPTSAAE